LRIELLREIPDDSRLRSAWNRLVHEMESAEVFYTYEWALSVSRAYPESHVPLLVLAWEDEQLVGVASLATTPNGYDAFFLAATTGDYCDFVSRPSDRNAFVSSVLERLKAIGINDLVFANLPADSATVPALRSEARHHGYYRYCRHAYDCAQISFQTAEERKKLRATSLGSKTLRRALHYLGKEGNVEFRDLKDRDAVVDALHDFSKMHVARFLATDRISNLCRPERRSFLRELSSQLGESGAISLSQLMVGDRPAAWNFGFQFGGSWFWYQPTFDSQWERHSPGLCLLAKMVAAGMEDGKTGRIDLGLGAEGYKDRFATATRETLHVTLSNQFSKYAGAYLRYHLAETVKSLPPLEKVSRSIRDQVSRGKSRLLESGPAHYLRQIVRGTWCRCFGRDEVLLYTWFGAKSNSIEKNENSLVAIDCDLLATAAMEYFDDEETLTYLRRSASRLRFTQGRGFALLNPSKLPVHFCWTSVLQNFEMAELNASISAPSETATVIFDSWTPAAKRGQGFFTSALGGVADLLVAEDRVPWTFTTTGNTAAVRGIEKCGFQPQHTLIRNKQFFVHQLRSRNSSNRLHPLAVRKAS
jgi:CelD/BcsL family acetyltransferase involved in cellulose biosynthesis/RimJ/RimL family protein N-acetyltransferase